MRRVRCGAVVVLALTAPASAAAAQAGQSPAADSVTIRFSQAELMSVLQALGRFLPKPLVVNQIPAARITIDYPGMIPRAQVVDIIRGLAESHDLVVTEEPGYFIVVGKKPEVATPRPPTVAPAPPGPVKLHVVRLKHARAADVAATVNQLYGGTGEFGPAGLSTPTLSESIRSDQEDPAPRTGRTQANLRGPLILVPDHLTNSLLVRATDSDFELVREAIGQLDIRPLQVLIEVLIVEARRDKTFSLGAAFDSKRVDGSDTYQTGFGGGSIGDVVIGFMHLGRSEIAATLVAAQSKGHVEIVSRPVILASNNTESRLLVGSQRPFVQVSRTLPTDSPLRDQVIQYRDVGTKLTVRPTINPDGYVALAIQQEISAATTENQFGAPVISTREATTQLLVRDGQTIVLGGLRDQQSDQTSNGIPILSGIPIVGGLFGSSSKRSATTELFLFLTPRIISTDAQADSLTAERLPERMKP